MRSHVHLHLLFGFLICGYDIIGVICVDMAMLAALLATFVGIAQHC